MGADVQNNFLPTLSCHLEVGCKGDRRLNDYLDVRVAGFDI